MFELDLTQDERHEVFVLTVGLATVPDSTAAREFCRWLITLADLENYPRRKAFIEAYEKADMPAVSAECWHLCQHPAMDEDWVYWCRDKVDFEQYFEGDI